MFMELGFSNYGLVNYLTRVDLVISSMCFVANEWSYYHKNSQERVFGMLEDMSCLINDKPAFEIRADYVNEACLDVLELVSKTGIICGSMLNGIFAVYHPTDYEP